MAASDMPPTLEQLLNSYANATELDEKWTIAADAARMLANDEQRDALSEADLEKLVDMLQDALQSFEPDDLIDFLKQTVEREDIDDDAGEKLRRIIDTYEEQAANGESNGGVDDEGKLDLRQFLAFMAGADHPSDEGDVGMRSGGFPNEEDMQGVHIRGGGGNEQEGDNVPEPAELVKAYEKSRTQAEKKEIALQLTELLTSEKGVRKLANSDTKKVFGILEEVYETVDPKELIAELRLAEKNGEFSGESFANIEKFIEALEPGQGQDVSDRAGNKENASTLTDDEGNVYNKISFLDFVQLAVRSTRDASESHDVSMRGGAGGEEVNEVISEAEKILASLGEASNSEEKKQVTQGIINRIAIVLADESQYDKYSSADLNTLFTLLRKLLSPTTQEEVFSVLTQVNKDLLALNAALTLEGLGLRELAQRERLDASAGELDKSRPYIDGEFYDFLHFIYWIQNPQQSQERIRGGGGGNEETDEILSEAGQESATYAEASNPELEEQAGRDHEIISEAEEMLATRAEAPDSEQKKQAMQSITDQIATILANDGEYRKHSASNLEELFNLLQRILGTKTHKDIFPVLTRQNEHFNATKGVKTLEKLGYDEVLVQPPDGEPTEPKIFTKRAFWSFLNYMSWVETTPEWYQARIRGGTGNDSDVKLFQQAPLAIINNWFDKLGNPQAEVEDQLNWSNLTTKSQHLSLLNSFDVPKTEKHVVREVASLNSSVLSEGMSQLHDSQSAMQRFWCRELDGTYSARTALDLKNLQPGFWNLHKSRHGREDFFYYVREKGMR